MEEQEQEQQYRLSIREFPWRARLEQLKFIPNERPSLSAQEFNDPLDLLEHLERHQPKMNGLK